MNMKTIRSKILFTLALIALVTSPIPAAADAFVCKQSQQLPREEASKIAGKLQKAYSSIEWFKARFVQDSYLAALDTSEVSSGNVWFHNPGEMKWHYADPEEQVFILRDKSLWFYQKEQRQVFVDELTTVLSSDLPVAFLTGIGSLEKSFSLLSGCPSAEEGVVLEFAPKGKGDSSDESPIEKLTLLVDSVSYLPAGAIVTDPTGSINKFFFSEISVPTNLLADRVFESKWPAGTDVIDRRNVTG
jgi:outer membrane lipoprotein-sorting protein